MQRRISPAATPACLALGLVVAGCGGRLNGGTGGESELAAEIDGQAITAAELDDRIAKELLRSRTGGSPAKLYELRSDTLEELIHERTIEAEAKRRGVPAEAVLDLELKELGSLPEEEIASFYREHLEKEGAPTLEEMRPRI